MRGADDLLRRAVGPTVQVNYEPNATLWLALADASQTELVILNLAINARDAMPSGGTILIETANVTRDNPHRPLELGADTDYVMLTIADNGTGMPAEVLEDCQPLYTTKEVGKGSGLGLSMALGVAQQSGGTVQIDSEVGRGTRVRVYLPRAQNQSAGALTTEGQPMGGERGED